jgi:hypothetical protein
MVYFPLKAVFCVRFTEISRLAESAPMTATEMNDTGCKRLLAGIVEQAVADLKRLQKRGKIVAGQVQNCSPNERSYSEAKSLLYFFSDASPLQDFFCVMKLELQLSTVRKQLNLP